MVEGLGDEDNGLLWERNPEKHRRISKAMSPAFSGKALRAKVPTMNKHIDLMMSNMKEYGAQEVGIDLSTVCCNCPAEDIIECQLTTFAAQWIGWLCMDTAADLAYGWEINQISDSEFKSSAYQ